MKHIPNWLEQAIFYQIYPQSYADSNGDGIGDLPGLIQKLDYIQSLGVNAIWLNPCFDSPFLDAGYDVRDYYTIAARYGTNEDMKHLLDEASKRGIRIILDLVAGHTSIEHPWFKESCRHEVNPYTDWYIWTDSPWGWDDDGYCAISGHAERPASFIANFFYHQPALNYGYARIDRPWQQPIDAPGPRAVRAEMLNVMRFWLEMGASGFRVDMAGSLVKNDYGGQSTAAFWRETRTWLETEYPDAVLVSEWANPRLSIGQGGFHMDFYLPFGLPGWASLFRTPDESGCGVDIDGPHFFDKTGKGNIRTFLDEYIQVYRASRKLGHLAFSTGNHDDSPRLGHHRDAEELELIFLFLLTMPGTPFIYYGDEIGMRGVDGLPSKEGAYARTAVRTPMQWNDGPNAGFSTASKTEIYLPIHPDPHRRTVSCQEADPASTLNCVRRLTRLRKDHPALCASGEFEPIYAKTGKYPFAYLRSLDDERILVALNPADRPVEAALADTFNSTEPQLLYGYEDSLNRKGAGWTIGLPGVSAAVYRL
jgi:glycosidase